MTTDSDRRMADLGMKFANQRTHQMIEIADLKAQLTEIASLKERIATLAAESDRLEKQRHAYRQEYDQQRERIAALEAALEAALDRQIVLVRELEATISALRAVSQERHSLK